MDKATPEDIAIARQNRAYARFFAMQAERQEQRDIADTHTIFQGYDADTGRSQFRSLGHQSITEARIITTGGLTVGQPVDLQRGSGSSSVNQMPRIRRRSSRPNPQIPPPRFFWENLGGTLEIIRQSGIATFDLLPPAIVPGQTIPASISYDTACYVDEIYSQYDFTEQVDGYNRYVGTNEGCAIYIFEFGGTYIDEFGQLTIIYNPIYNGETFDYQIPVLNPPEQLPDSRYSAANFAKIFQRTGGRIKFQGTYTRNNAGSIVEFRFLIFRVAPSSAFLTINNFTSFRSLLNSQFLINNPSIPPPVTGFASFDILWQILESSWAASSQAFLNQIGLFRARRFYFVSEGGANGEYTFEISDPNGPGSGEDVSSCIKVFSNGVPVSLSTRVAQLAPPFISINQLANNNYLMVASIRSLDEGGDSNDPFDFQTQFTFGFQ